MAKATTKPFWQSTTLQGQMVAVLGLATRLVDFPLLAGEGEALVATVFTLIGICMSIYGRIKTKGEKLTK